MKKNLFWGVFLTLLGKLCAFGQINFPSLNNQQVRILAQNAPDKRLLEYAVFPFGAEFSRDSTYKISTENWFNSGLVLQQAAYNNQYALFPNLEILEAQNQLLSANGINKLGLFCVWANEVDSNAYSDGRIMLDSMNGWYPATAMDQSFYRRTLLAGVAPLSLKLPYDTVNQRYHTIFSWQLPANQIFVDAGYAIDSFSMNFLDGRGWIQAYPNQTIQSDLIHMPQIGYWWVRWKFENQWIYRKVQFQITLSDIQELNRNAPNKVIHWNDIAPYNKTNVYTEKTAEARMYAFTANADGKIGKPVIFVEGFDPDPNQENLRYGSIGANLRSGKILPIGYTDTSNNYSQLIGFKHLADSILKLGLDLIIVDFKEGGTLIERNAQAFSACINYLKANKTGTHEMMVIGASMGGLISRYALKRMEQLDAAHCVSTWVSFDSPHLGANIPISYQGVLRFLANGSYSARKNYKTKLMCDAAQQMLVNHLDSVTNAGRRVLWDQSLKKLGFPHLTKNYCVTNGNTTGQIYNLQPNENIFEYDVKFKFHVDVFVNDTSEANQLVARVKMNFMANPKNSGDKFYRKDSVYYEYTPGGLAETGSDLMVALNDALNSNVKFSNYRSERHSFIPVHSAIADESISPFGPWNYQRNAAFDEIFRQADTCQRHVEVTYQNTKELYRIIQNHLDSVPEFLPKNNEKQYNIVKSIPSLSQDMVIAQGGKWYCNGYVPKGFSSNAIMNNPSTQISISTGSCGHSIRIQDGGQLILGGQNPTSFPNTVQFFLTKGSVLELEPNSTLEINDGSTLTLLPGSILIIHPGAVISLQGSRAQLVIRSSVELKDNASLSFQGSGQMSFQIPNTVNQHWLRTGKHCSINFTANTLGHIPLIIEDQCAFRTPASLELVKMMNGMVMLGNQASIEIDGAAFLKDMTYTSARNGYGTHLGVHFYGQSNIFVQRCLFKNGAQGLVSNQKSGSKSISINLCTFERNNQGLSVIGKGGSITNCQFRLNQVAFWGRDLETQTIFRNNTFTNDSIDVQLKGQKTSSVFFQGNTWFNATQRDALFLECGSSTFTCNQFDGYHSCINQTGGTLQLGNKAGNRFNAQIAIDLNNVEEVNMQNGLNQFNQVGQFLIGGTMVSNQALNQIQGQLFLEVDSNQIPNSLLSTQKFNQNPLLYWESNTQQFIPIGVHGSFLNPVIPACQQSVLQNQLQGALQQIENSSTSIIYSNGNSFSDELTTILLDWQNKIDSANYALPFMHRMAHLLENRPVNPQNDDEFVQKIAHQCMMQLLALSFEQQMLVYNRAQVNTALGNDVDRVIQLIDDFKLDVLPTETDELSNLDLEKAQVYRLSEHYDYAINSLENLRNYATGNDLAETEYWHCVCQAEQDFMQGFSSRKAFEDSLSQCRNYIPLLRKKGYQTTWLNELSDASNIQVQPISQDFYQLLLPNSNSAYTLFDAQSKVVFRGSFQHGMAYLSVQNYVPGMYFLVTDNGQKVSLSISQNR